MDKINAKLNKYRNKLINATDSDKVELYNLKMQQYLIMQKKLMKQGGNLFAVNSLNNMTNDTISKITSEKNVYSSDAVDKYLSEVLGNVKNASGLVSELGEENKNMTEQIIRTHREAAKRATTKEFTGSPEFAEAASALKPSEHALVRYYLNEINQVIELKDENKIAELTAELGLFEKEIKTEIARLLGDRVPPEPIRKVLCVECSETEPSKEVPQMTEPSKEVPQMTEPSKEVPQMTEPSKEVPAKEQLLEKSQCAANFPKVFETLQEGKYNGTDITSLKSDQDVKSLLQFLNFEENKENHKKRKIMGYAIDNIMRSCHPDKNVGFESEVQNIAKVLNFLKDLEVSESMITTVPSLENAPLAQVGDEPSKEAPQVAPPVQVGDEPSKEVNILTETAVPPTNNPFAQLVAEQQQTEAPVAPAPPVAPMQGGYRLVSDHRRTERQRIEKLKNMFRNGNIDIITSTENDF